MTNTAGRAFVALFLVAATVSCRDSSDPCSSGGCAFGGGSPHPYSSSSGGAGTATAGALTVSYDDGQTALQCGLDAECIWSQGSIEIDAALPREWLTEDAGADAGADVDADADAGVDVDAGDAALGSPRGWGEHGRIALVDLGTTPRDASSPLVGARLVICGDRYEKLASTSDGGFVCVSDRERPPRIEPLEGTLDFTSTGTAETGSSTTKLDATTGSGGRISLTRGDHWTPYHSWTSVDCY